MERELWQALYLLATSLDKRWGRWKYSTAEIVAVYFWAVLHDRPTSWAAQPAEWPADLRPEPLPPQSTLSRRLKKADAVELMTAVEQQLVVLIGLGKHWIHVLDGKPLAVSPISHDRDAAWGRGARGMQKGYKVHAVWNGGPLFTTWALAPMNMSEKTVARRMMESLLGGGYLLADSQYDANYLYDAAENAGFQLVARKTPGRGRNGLGHRRHSPSRLRSIELLTTRFGSELYRERNAIERVFGVLTSTGGILGPLPAWVRRFNRVRHWVHAKLILNALRWIKIRQPQLLAYA
jgi:Transposase DDE domain